MEQDGIEIVGDITDIETIATGRGIRRLKHLRKHYGGRRWRKLKGVAMRTCGLSTSLEKMTRLSARASSWYENRREKPSPLAIALILASVVPPDQPGVNAPVQS